MHSIELIDYNLYFNIQRLNLTLIISFDGATFSSNVYRPQKLNKDSCNSTRQKACRGRRRFQATNLRFAAQKGSAIAVLERENNFDKRVNDLVKPADKRKRGVCKKRFDKNLRTWTKTGHLAAELES